MPVCKVIFRLDFKLHFGIIDSPGKIFEIFWDTLNLGNRPNSQLSKSPVHRIISVQTRDGERGPVASFNASPSTFDGALEKIEGIELLNLLETEPLLSLVRLAGRLCENFNIDIISRSGFRLIYLGKVGDSFQDALASFNGFFKPNYITSVEEKLGRISDVGIIWEGADESGVKYRCHSGPYRSQEAPRYFTSIIDKISTSSDFDTICDLDLYEQNFSISKRTISNLYRPIVLKANKFIKDLENGLIQNMEKTHANRK